MIAVNRKKYWDKLIDYYYDHVHFESNNITSIHQWLNEEFNVKSSTDQQKIVFASEPDYVWFKLRWD